MKRTHEQELFFICIVKPIKAALFSCFQPQVIDEHARLLQSLLLRNLLILENLHFDLALEALWHLEEVPVIVLPAGNHSDFVVVKCINQANEPT